MITKHKFLFKSGSYFDYVNISISKDLYSAREWNIFMIFDVNGGNDYFCRRQWRNIFSYTHWSQRYSVCCLTSLHQTMRITTIISPAKLSTPNRHALPFLLLILISAFRGRLTIPLLYAQIHRQNELPAKISSLW